jgi:CRP-like cAMP-binding protein
MSDDAMRLLEAVGTEERFPAEHVLIERGQTGSGLYVVLDGAVVVEAPEGTRELGPGAIVGERALLSADGRLTARVRTTAETRVLAVPRAEVDRLLAEDPSLASRLQGV